MKTNTNLFWHVCIVFATVILGVWIACQSTAASLGYSPKLGDPWFDFQGTPIYQPWRFFEWWFSFEAYAPEVFARGGMIAKASGFAAILVAVSLSVYRSRAAKYVSTYGSSRWAERRDIKKAGLFNNDGVFLGQTKKAYLRHDGPEHVMAFAPTRSGKGVGLVVPTLLSWQHSAVIHDIKGENWDLTAGWRDKFSRTLKFDPTSLKSIRYNPLQEVRRGDNEVRDAQNIADILVDPEGALNTRNHWDKTAHTLLVGTILHVLYAERDKTLSGVAEFLSNPVRDISDTLDLMLQTNHVGDAQAPKVHPIIAQCAREVKNKTDAERSGVVSTALTFLQLYRDPVVAAATSACDFRLADLIEPGRPVSLYLTVPPSDISRTKPLIRLMLNQIGRRLTEDAHQDTPREQVLFMLDEFPTLGRLDFFESALGYMASYGLRAYLITQSLNQIDKAYGPNNAVLDHCHVRVAFATNDERTAKRISDALGTTTEQRAMKNYAGHRLAPWLSHVMVSRQETARQLLTPGEIMQLPADEEVLLISGARPIRARKIKYYEDRNFIDRCLPAPIPQTPFEPKGAEELVDDWNDVTASIHADLMLKKSKGPDDPEGSASAGGKERKPELDSEHKPVIEDHDIDPSTEDMEQNSDIDNDKDQIRDAHNFDQSNDIGMLGKGRDQGGNRND